MAQNSLSKRFLTPRNSLRQDASSFCSRLGKWATTMSVPWSGIRDSEAQQAPLFAAEQSAGG
jgi:hypothetical protein